MKRFLLLAALFCTGFLSAQSVTLPNPATVKPGTPITISVTVSGIGPFTYQWLRAPAAGQAAVPIPAPIGTGATIVAPAVLATDGGIYSVVVTNQYGSTTSNTFTLNVGSPPVVSGPTATSP